MVHLSRDPLERAQARQLADQLAAVVANGTAHDAKVLFRGLLGTAELEMIAKRLAVILMLHDGCSAYRIAKTLHMSHVTVDRIGENFDAGEFSALVRTIGKRKKDRDQLWRTIELLVQAGLPPRGKGRWRSVYKKMQRA